MTVGLAVYALIVGLALAMFFAVWGVGKIMASCRVGRFSAGNHSAWPARNSGGAVYLFWLLAAAADAFGWLHYQSWVRADPSADGH